MTHVSLERFGNQGSGISADRHDLLGLGHSTTIKHPESKAAIDLIDHHDLRILLHCQPPQCLGGRTTATVLASCLDRPSNANFSCNAFNASVNEIASQDGLVKTEPRKPEPLTTSHGDRAHKSRSELGGYRTLKMIISTKIRPITTLAGADFVKAWLEVVKFHAYSWSTGLEHNDPSLWNVLYDDNTKSGVLGDLDRSTSGHKSHIIQEGTIPFMSRDLLKEEYWRGEATRLYRHELEAFTWLLSFVFMRYQGGKPQCRTVVDDWMTSDYKTCAFKKFLFVFDALKHEGSCQADYLDHWPVSASLLYWTYHNEAARQDPDRDLNLELGSDVADMWPPFVEGLKRMALAAARRTPPILGYLVKLVDELDLDSLLTPGGRPDKIE